MVVAALPRSLAAIGIVLALLSAVLLAGPEPAQGQVPPEPVPVPAPAPAQEVSVTRLGGTGRVETAVQISRATFTSADTVLLARADAYPDALVGAPLAAALDAPILLTNRNELLPPVAEELGRLGAERVVLLGGAQALSGEVASELESAGLDVTRVSGADRFGTAAEVARTLEGGGDVAFLALGGHPDPDSGWPDALAVGPYAAFLGAPVLLTTTDELPEATAAALDELAIAEVVIVGGEGVVAAEVETALGEAGYSTRRLAGATRYETSAAIYDEALTRGLDPAVRWLATGRNFPDALAAGAAAAAGGQPLLLLDGLDHPVISTPTSERLLTAFELLEEVRLLGGTAAITAEVAAGIEQHLSEEGLGEAAFCLTLLHVNDGESRLLDAGTGLEDFGGAARFATLVRQEQQTGAAGAVDDGCERRGVLTLSAGDNFLAGPFFSASLEKEPRVPFYDSVLYDELDFDAMTLGNHEFDFLPPTLAEFIEGFSSDVPFLSANLSFPPDGEPEMAQLVEERRVLPSTLLDVAGVAVGVLGLTTDQLASDSSPRNTQIQQLTPDFVQGHVDALRAAGAEIVVVSGHLQGLQFDEALFTQVSGVDLIVAGGGGELLGSPGDLYLPGEHTSLQGFYPEVFGDADGDGVPTVVTPGNYTYLGRLRARFDAGGDLIGIDTRRSRLLRVADASLPAGVERDPVIAQQVEAPVAAYVADLAENVVGTSEVALDGRRETIRVEETNLGNLITDSLLWQANELAGEYGYAPARVAMQNGGGVRNENVIPPGPITELNTFEIAAFSNFVAVQEDIDAAELKLVLESANRNLPEQGNFVQVAGMTVEVDISLDPLTLDDEGEITFTGDRVRSVTLDDGTQIVVDGAPVASAPAVNVATIDFLARGGSDTPYSSETFVSTDRTYQQALRDYIQQALGGQITATDYPEGGEGRVVITGG